MTHVVTIAATSFQPAALTIRTGDSVLWVNKDVMPHTATSTPGQGFDSGTLAPGGSWKQAFGKVGRFPYVCVFHPTMKASLQVR